MGLNRVKRDSHTGNPLMEQSNGLSWELHRLAMEVFFSRKSSMGKLSSTTSLMTPEGFYIFETSKITMWAKMVVKFAPRSPFSDSE